MTEAGDVSAGLSQPDRDRLPYAAACTRDERHVAIQSEKVHWIIPSGLLPAQIPSA
jgi:hypothetical protein